MRTSTKKFLNALSVMTFVQGAYADQSPYAEKNSSTSEQEIKKDSCNMCKDDMQKQALPEPDFRIHDLPEFCATLEAGVWSTA